MILDRKLGILSFLLKSILHDISLLPIEVTKLVDLYVYEYATIVKQSWKYIHSVDLVNPFLIMITKLHSDLTYILHSQNKDRRHLQMIPKVAPPAARRGQIFHRHQPDGSVQQCSNNPLF